MVVGEVVACGNMFRGEHGASVEDADEEVCRVGGTWIGLDSHREAVWRSVKKDELVSSVNVQW